MRIHTVLAGCAIVLATGCEKVTPPPKTEPPSTNQVAAEPSAVNSTIGTMLQYDTLKAGRKAQDRARQAVAAHNERAAESTSPDQ